MLFDESLSRHLAADSRAASFDAHHVVDVGLGSADDAVVLELARREGRVLITSDTDFGELLAKSSAPSPSVIIFRGQQDMRRSERLTRLLDVLQQYADDLQAGAVVIIEAGRVRSKRLPIRS